MRNIPRQRRFYNENTYLKYLLFVTLINIYVFYYVYKSAELNENEAITTDWEPSPTQDTYLEANKGDVLVRYQDSTHHRLRLKPHNRAQRCPRKTNPNINPPTSTVDYEGTSYFPSSEVAETQTPNVDQDIETEPPKCKFYSQGSTDSALCDLDTTTSTPPIPPSSTIDYEGISLPTEVSETTTPNLDQEDLADHLPKCQVDTQSSPGSTQPEICDWDDTTTTETAYIEETPSNQITYRYIIMGFQLALFTVPIVAAFLCNCFAHDRERVQNNFVDPFAMQLDVLN